MVSTLVERKFNNIFLKWASLVISFPIILIFVILQSAIPVFAIVGYSFFLVFYSLIIPLILIGIIKYFGLLELNDVSVTFILLTLTSCIVLCFYKPFIRIVQWHGPFKPKSEKYKDYKLDKLSDYLINRQNIRFVIYTSYFIYLFWFSTELLSDSGPSEELKHFRGIYQSFLCFLAFDRIIAYSAQMKFLPSYILNVLIKNQNNDSNRDNSQV